MKKTFLAATLLVAMAVSTTASFAFSWSSLNPANWGNKSCSKCEKVCKKDCCDTCKPKCDPCKKDKCDPCKPKCDCNKKCNPCEQKAQCTPCNPCQTNNCKPMPECNACDKIQEVTER